MKYGFLRLFFCVKVKQRLCKVNIICFRFTYWHNQQVSERRLSFGKFLIERKKRNFLEN